MDNFFSNAIDFNAFKKALKTTKGETVVINILSSDDSLKTPSNDKTNKQRKSMSSKFEPSPFGKFFGARNNGPVDMNDFSGWKNKNYRKTEESFDSDFEDDDDSLFSLSNYMKDKSSDTFNDLDQARTDIQKPITQLPNDDPTLQKFSLDGYMHKLEESILAKDKFSQNEDLLEPIISDEDFINRSTTKQINKHQDENFYGANDDIERFAFDGGDVGSRFSLDSDELDRVRDRLDKLEKEARNIKDKPTEKLITGEEQLVEDEPKDSFDEVTISDDTLIETATEPTTKRGKKLNEVVMHTDTAVKAGSNVIPAQRAVLISTDDIDVEPTEQAAAVLVETKKGDVLTREDFMDMTNEFMSKLSETLGRGGQPNVVTGATGGYVDGDYYAGQDGGGYETEEGAPTTRINQDEMQMKINELMESRERSERETAEKFKKIEEERQKIDEEYKSKIKEMEESYSKKYEEFKQKMYLEKLDSERKVKENEAKIKRKNSELENKLNNKQVGAILRKELKSNFNISNLEMEKKLLEYEKQVGTKAKEEEEVKVEKPKPKKTVKKQPVATIVKETPKAETKPAPKRNTRPRTKRRRIDSDIIGGIQF